MPARIIVFSNTSKNLEFGRLLKWVYVFFLWDFWGCEGLRILHVKACTLFRFYLSWELSVQKYGGEEEEVSLE